MIKSRLTSRFTNACGLAKAFRAIILIGLIGKSILFAQTSVPIDAGKTPSNGSSLGISSSDASAVTVPTELETEREQILHVDSLLENQDELQFRAPALSGINESALGIEIESNKNKVSSLALEVSGGYTSNLYNRSVDQIGSGFGRYSFPITINIFKSRARFAASYLPQLTNYSAANGLYQTHVYNHTLLYSLSARTTLSWQLTGAHYRDVGQFLPVVLPAGGIGIAEPTGQVSNTASISTVSNVATSVALLHNFSVRDNAILTGTAAWNELLQAASSVQTAAPSILRNQSFIVDAIYEHALTASIFLGIDGTEAYVRGLSSSTNVNYQTILGTFRYNFTPYDRFSIGAGPLILSSSGKIASSTQSGGTTYALKVQYAHQSRIATVSSSYARILQLGLDNSATPANQLTGTFMRPVTSNLDVTFDLRYIHTGSNSAEFRQSNFGGTLRFDYRTKSRLSWFAVASQTYSSQPQPGTTTSNFNRGEISGGLRFALDHKPTS